MGFRYFRNFSLGFCIVAGVIFISVPKVHAETTDRYLSIDEATIQEGYTFSSTDGNLVLTIPKNLIHESVTIKIKKSTLDETSHWEGKNLTSDVFVYGIRLDEPQTFLQPVTLAMTFNSQSSFRKRIYFFDRNVETWSPLPTIVDRKARVATTRLPFPWLTVAVFENLQKEEGPERRKFDSEPVLLAESGIVLDPESEKVLFAKNPDEEWWLASLTKLMTAIVFLETNPDFRKIVTYSEKDHAGGGRLTISPGETLTARDLFFTMLVGSSNNAANALVRSTGLSRKAFVNRMNKKSESLGLTKTVFSDVSGLDLGNRSTARECSQIVREASRYPDILRATTYPLYAFTTVNSRQSHRIKNTNRLLGQGYRFLLSKTGYLDEARYNFAANVEKVSGHPIIIVTLGSPSSAIRFNETRQLIDWTYANYQWL